MQVFGDSGDEAGQRKKESSQPTLSVFTRRKQFPNSCVNPACARTCMRKEKENNAVPGSLPGASTRVVRLNVAYTGLWSDVAWVVKKHKAWATQHSEWGANNKARTMELLLVYFSIFNSS